MILKKLTLKNYKQYKDLELSFKEGLVGIIGRNGAGKSTLFDAILYCLFGRDEDHKTLVRSTYSPEKAIVELQLEFEIDLQTYRVKREFRGKALTTAAELYKDTLLIAKDSRPVNEQVALLLNMERDAFKRSVFSGQKELGELSDTSGEARKKMIRRMVGLERLDEIQATLNSDTKSFKNQIVGQTQNLLSNDDLTQRRDEIANFEREYSEKIVEKNAILDILKGKDAEYKVIIEKYEKEEDKFNKYVLLNNNLAQSEASLIELDINIKTLLLKKQEIESIQTSCKKQEPEILAFEAQKKELSEMQLVYDKILRRNHFETQQKIWKDGLPVIEKKIIELKNQSVDLDHLKLKCLGVSNDLISAKEAKGRLQNQKQEILNEISIIQGKINDRNEKLENIKKLGRTGTCPTCTQRLFLVFDSTIAEINRQISDYESNDINQHKFRLNSIEDAVRQSDIKIVTIEKENQELIKQVSQLEQVKKQLQEEEQQKEKYIRTISEHQKSIDAFGELVLDRQKFEDYKLKIQNFDNQYLDYKNREGYVNTELPKTNLSIIQTNDNITNRKERISQIKQSIIDLNFSDDFFEKVKTEKILIENQISEIKDLIYQKELDLKDVENNINRVKQIVKNHFDIIVQIEDKKNEIDLLEKLSSIIGEFKTNILEKISPTISREASLLFNRITKGKYEHIKVDENFDFYILDNGKFFPISRFSGGEIDLGNFCLRIAITKAISELSGLQATLNFLAFDEIFGSQDEDRRYEIMLALNFLQEQFKQIYIISHVETIKEYFPNILEVSLETDGSSIKWL
jgi:exonuclease SbcC